MNRLRDIQRPSKKVNIPTLGELDFRELSYGEVRHLRGSDDEVLDDTALERKHVALLELSCYCDGAPLFNDDDAKDWLRNECALTVWKALLEACVEANPLMATQQIEAVKN